VTKKKKGNPVWNPEGDWEFGEFSSTESLLDYVKGNLDAMVEVTQRELSILVEPKARGKIRLVVWPLGTDCSHYVINRVIDVREEIEYAIESDDDAEIANWQKLARLIDRLTASYSPPPAPEV
jgi:hypothetical protein